jgi:hypothetical protein
VSTGWNLIVFTQAPQSINEWSQLTPKATPSYPNQNPYLFFSFLGVILFAPFTELLALGVHSLIGNSSGLFGSTFFNVLTLFDFEFPLPLTQHGSPIAQQYSRELRSNTSVAFRSDEGPVCQDPVLFFSMGDAGGVSAASTSTGIMNTTANVKMIA